MFVLIGLILLALCGFLYHEFKNGRSNGNGGKINDQKSKSDAVTFDTKELVPSLDMFLKPIVGVLPRKQSTVIYRRKEHAMDNVTDLAAQIVFMDEHLSKVKAAHSCDLQMLCNNGLDFNAKCIKEQVSKDSVSKLGKLDSILTSGRATFADRCKARFYLKSVA
mmetsp:Transcript_37746/g.49650  ORF Transcript_37746/g.49650 Transcript_37746/m.49650 type:complete len:164 (-) Transcript_37746:136-627(-)